MPEALSMRGMTDTIRRQAFKSSPSPAGGRYAFLWKEPTDELPASRCAFACRGEPTAAAPCLVALLSACARARLTPSLLPNRPAPATNQGAQVGLEIIIPRDPKRANCVSRSTRSIVVRRERGASARSRRARGRARVPGERSARFASVASDRMNASSGAYDQRSSKTPSLSRGTSSKPSSRV